MSLRWKGLMAVAVGSAVMKMKYRHGDPRGILTVPRCLVRFLLLPSLKRVQLASLMGGFLQSRISLAKCPCCRASGIQATYITVTATVQLWRSAGFRPIARQPLVCVTIWYGLRTYATPTCTVFNTDGAGSTRIALVVLAPETIGPRSGSSMGLPNASVCTITA